MGSPLRERSISERLTWRDLPPATTQNHQGICLVLFVPNLCLNCQKKNCNNKKYIGNNCGDGLVARYCSHSGSRFSRKALMPSLVSRCSMFSTITSPV